MSHLEVDSQEANLEDFAHKVESLLDLQGRPRGIAKKEGQWSEAVRRNTKGLKRREKPRHVMVVKNTGTSSTSDKDVRSSENTSTRVLNIIVSAPVNNANILDSTFMDSGTYCLV